MVVAFRKVTRNSRLSWLTHAFRLDDDDVRNGECGTWVGCGRVQYEHTHHGYPDYERLQKSSPTSICCAEASLSTEVHRSTEIQMPLRHNLDDDEASLCSEWGEESAFNEPTVLSGETPSFRLYLVAQFAGVTSDGQRWPGARLRGLTLLILSLVLDFV